MTDLESLSARLPDNTADCQSLALDYQAALGRVGALEAELNILKSHTATESGIHDYNGDCPDELNPLARDPDCYVCWSLLQFEKLQCLILAHTNQARVDGTLSSNVLLMELSDIVGSGEG